jgi:hypothetical protein
VSATRIWKGPLLLAALKVLGLLAALLEQEMAWRLCSWVALATPLLVISWCVLKAK